MQEIKNQQEILDKLGIEQLNPMQEQAQEVINSKNEVVLLSPTGTGKTLAFLLPLIASLDANSDQIQLLIVVPTRELAIQIEQVVREMGSGFKANAVYGGQNFSKDRVHLQHLPAILIGTPGRVADHLRRRTFHTREIKTLVLDEFDKSLEIGFDSDMQTIVESLPNVKKKILTSATEGVTIPKFTNLNRPYYIDYLDEKNSQLEIKIVLSPEKDKLQTLVKTLSLLGNEPGIVFCNFKESIERVSNYLTEIGISHGTFHGGMEQRDRERALIKFRNGTHQLLVSTDLAARGIDIPELTFIIHYHLPTRAHEFTHRNGRTARMNSNGTAYVLQWKGEGLPDFVDALETVDLPDNSPLPDSSEWHTLFISGGRKDKISKGDVAGLFFKQGKLEKDQLGVIELKQDCAFVAVKSNDLDGLIQVVNNTKLKKKKVRVSEV